MITSTSHSRLSGILLLILCSQSVALSQIYETYDDFEDGTIDTTLWWTSGPVSEHGGKIILGTEGSTGAIPQRISGMRVSACGFQDIEVPGHVNYWLSAATDTGDHVTVGLYRHRWLAEDPNDPPLENNYVFCQRKGPGGVLYEHINLAPANWGTTYVLRLQFTSSGSVLVYVNGTQVRSFSVPGADRAYSTGGAFMFKADSVEPDGGGDVSAELDWAEVLYAPPIAVVELRAPDPLDVPIQGVDDPVWQKEFDGNCDLAWVPDSEHDAICAIGGRTLQIYASLGQCFGDTSWTPRVECAAAILLNGASADTRSGGTEFNGWDGTIEVALPREVNDTTLKLKFDIYRDTAWLRTDHIERELFIVLDEPGIFPSKSRLRRATEWANGAESADEVMAMLVSAIYQHSGWLYRDESFPWFWLVDGVVDEGNCVSFSDAWNNLCKVLGVSGTKTQKTCGWFDCWSPIKGFLTTKPAIALAPEYLEGNAYPPLDPNMDRWQFAMHQVGVGGSEVYDPAFGAAPYASIDELIEAYVTDVILLDLPGLPPVFLGWELSNGGECWWVGEDEWWGEWTYFGAKAPVTQTARDGGATFNGIYDAQATDEDGDGRYEAIVVSSQVDISLGGDYSVTGSISSDTEFITNRAGVDHTVPTGDAISADSGLVVVELSFSGEDIRASGFDGPYTVNLALLDSSGTVIDGLGIETEVYVASDFGERSAEIISMIEFGDDTDGDSLYDLLVCRVDVEAHRAMDFTVAGMLLVDETIVATGTEEGSLPMGMGSLEITFDGRQINGAMEDGPYTLELQFYDAGGRQIDETTLESGPYACDDFDPAAVRLTGPFTEYGEDVNGNGLSDFLVFEVIVDVQKVGDYGVVGWLQDGLGENITWAGTNVTLATGSQPVTLRYAGLDINRHGADGPYVVSYVVVTADDGHFVTAATNLYTTGAYSSEEFERFGDLDSDGDVDLDDLTILVGCLAGPDRPIPPTGCHGCDLQSDNDVDIADFAAFQAAFADSTP